MKITNTIQLKEAIALLEADQAMKKDLVAQEYHVLYESLKPANLIRNSFKKIADSPSLARNIIGTSLGVGAGLLSKKILIGKSTNIFKKLFGAILELTVARTVARNAGGIAQQGAGLIKKLSN
jgi:hypothetical protein